MRKSRRLPRFTVLCTVQHELTRNTIKSSNKNTIAAICKMICHFFCLGEVGHFLFHCASLSFVFFVSATGGSRWSPRQGDSGQRAFLRRSPKKHKEVRQEEATIAEGAIWRGGKSCLGNRGTALGSQKPPELRNCAKGGGENRDKIETIK